MFYAPFAPDAPNFDFSGPEWDFINDPNYDWGFTLEPELTPREKWDAKFKPAQAGPQLALGDMGGPITQTRSPFTLPTASPEAQGQTEVSKALRAAPAAPAMAGGQ